MGEPESSDRAVDEPWLAKNVEIIESQGRSATRALKHGTMGAKVSDAISADAPRVPRP